MTHKAKVNTVFFIALAVIMYAFYVLFNTVIHSNVLECIRTYRAIPVDFFLGVIAFTVLLASVDDLLNGVTAFAERKFK